MILDLEQATGHEFDNADVCIIGAGAAGITLAVELLRLGRRVLVLEGGGKDVEERSQDPYKSELVGLRHNGIHTGRFRAYGGTTTKWGGQILELDAIDFTCRDWIQGSGWPFPKSELTQHYRRALELEGIASSTLDDRAVWHEIGLERPVLGEKLAPYFSRWCPEPNFTRLHRDVLERHKNLGIYLHANACRLLTGVNERTISGVTCRTLEGKEVIFRAKEFVLCLGAIESSRFLLQPDANGKQRWNEYGLVGKYYQDHIDCNCAEVKKLNEAKFHAYFDNVYSRGYKYHPKFKLIPELQQRHRVLNVAGTMVFRSDMDETLNQVKQTAKNLLRGRKDAITGKDISNLIGNMPAFLRQGYHYKVKHRAYNPASSQIFLRVHCEQEPLSSSTVSLSEERDALGLLRARLDWKVSDLEIQTIQRFIETVRDVLETYQLCELKIDPNLYSDDGSFLKKVDDSNHHMGGTRMGTSGSNGVVDTNLKLHAAENGYVCSSSVFPASGFSNPTHTLLALAVRLGEHLHTKVLTAAIQMGEKT
jgi:choline dehydrogenase-like flavoprotein